MSTLQRSKHRATCFLYVRVSPDEKKQIEREAEKRNFHSVAEFMRKTVLDTVDEHKTP